MHEPGYVPDLDTVPEVNKMQVVFFAEMEVTRGPNWRQTDDGEWVPLDPGETA